MVRITCYPLLSIIKVIDFLNCKVKLIFPIEKLYQPLRNFALHITPLCSFYLINTFLLHICRASLPPRGSGKLYVHSTLPRPHLMGLHWVCCLLFISRVFYVKNIVFCVQFLSFVLLNMYKNKGLQFFNISSHFIKKNISSQHKLNELHTQDDIYFNLFLKLVMVYTRWYTYQQLMMNMWPINFVCVFEDFYWVWFLC